MKPLKKARPKLRVVHPERLSNEAIRRKLGRHNPPSTIYPVVIRACDDGMLEASSMGAVPVEHITEAIDAAVELGFELMYVYRDELTLAQIKAVVLPGKSLVREHGERIVALFNLRKAPAAAAQA